MSRYVSRPAEGEKWWIGSEDDTGADSDQNGSIDSYQEDENTWLTSAKMFSITLTKQIGNPSKGSTIGKQRWETITLAMNSILSLDWDQTAKQKFFNESASKEFDAAR